MGSRSSRERAAHKDARREGEEHVPAIQPPRPANGKEQEGGEVRQVEALIEDQGRLEASVREEHVGVENGKGRRMGLGGGHGRSRW